MTCLCAMPNDGTSYIPYVFHSWHEVLRSIHRGLYLYLRCQLDSLLYQLHTLSFLLSPSIWFFLCRTLSQFQFGRPRDIDPDRSPRFWCALSLMVNAGSVYWHAKEGPAEGRSIILDFVGMGMFYMILSSSEHIDMFISAHVPSRAQLLLLDFTIIFLQILLVIISFETSLAAAMPEDTPDPLLPDPSPDTSASSDEPSKNSNTASLESPYVLDLRLSLILDRLRHAPPPPPGQESSADLLPLPNTTSMTHLRRLLLVRAELRERTRAQEADTRRRGDERQTESDDADEGQRRVPGGMDLEDG